MRPIFAPEPEMAGKAIFAVEAAQPAAPVLVHARASSSSFGVREVITGFLATLLVGLAILLTPVTQVVGGMQLLAVMSGSMEPTIQVGGIVGVRPVPVSDLQVGEVITFANASNPDVLITHRIVGLEARDGQTLITTKGDANNAVDAVAVTGTRAVGRVDFTLPWLGYLMVWLASPLAKAGILIIAVIGFALPSTRRKSETVVEALAPRSIAAAVQPNAKSYAAFEREIEALLPRAS
jgi:signal peptidase